MFRKKSVFIFHPKLERLYFVIFFVFLILTIAMSVQWIPTVRWSQTWTRWIVAFVFFNSLHTMLTWIGIFLLPELRAWAKTQLSSRRIPIISILFVGIFLAVTQMVSQFSSAGTEVNTYLSPMTPYLSIMLLILAAMHNVGQTKGMSMLYNAGLRSRLGADEVPAAVDCERRERWFFNVLVGAVFLGLFCREVSDEYADYIPVQATTFLAAIAAIAFIAIILNSMKYPKVSESNKTLFSFTSVFHVLLTISPASFVFQRALHGVEYVFLAQKMAARSKISWKASAVAAAVVLMFVAVATKVANIYYMKTGTSTAIGFDITAIVVLGLWVEYAHYYIDSIMFRMTDEDARRFVGPLLKNTAQPT
jgi:hypothetical protein